METITVIAAIIKKNDKILIASRKNSMCGNSGWEFPGGKVELEESFQQCLIREINEEFCVDIRVGEIVAESKHKIPNKIIHLIAFDAEIVSGEITLQVHDKILFVEPEKLLDYNLLPADIPIAKIIMDKK